MRTSKIKSDKEVLNIGTLSKEAPNKEILSKEAPNKETLSKEVPNKEALSIGTLHRDSPNKEDRVYKQKPPSMVDGFIGKDIYIILRNGNKLEGKLESVVQYEIIVTILHQPVIIMKHAIDYIGLVSK